MGWNNGGECLLPRLELPDGRVEFRPGMSGGRYHGNIRLQRSKFGPSQIESLFFSDSLLEEGHISLIS